MSRSQPRNLIRDAIIDRLSARADVDAHPCERRAGPTKYIAAFVNKRGTAFAVDLMSASKQPIWFLDRPELRSKLEAAGVDYELYPPKRGRNSNLHKIPGFKHGALIRAYPEDVDSAMRIVDML
ncbi:hypothetical protein [Oceanibacterium hippocampi]|uniref:Uncharacterized protein n=1 Tax=Oceanibacterium hippocampi TaxID=745714 RepID=A0A1Y5U0A2_9PROT|nr:hypothetical protein [Oceanibacterium hippocampi]SLN77772.1 hypothetical protein OCH7691_04537 [Oceanibacterium hippocampi]